MKERQLKGWQVRVEYGGYIFIGTVLCHVFHQLVFLQVFLKLSRLFFGWPLVCLLEMYLSQTKFSDISLMNFQNSRIIILTYFQIETIFHSIAANMVKLNRLVCIVCTLVFTIRDACNGLPSPPTAILSSPWACVNTTFESTTDWPLKFPDFPPIGSIFLKFPDFKSNYFSIFPRFPGQVGTVSTNPTSLARQTLPTYELLTSLWDDGECFHGDGLRLVVKLQREQLHHPTSDKRHVRTKQHTHKLGRVQTCAL